MDKGSVSSHLTKGEYSWWLPTWAMWLELSVLGLNCCTPFPAPTLPPKDFTLPGVARLTIHKISPTLYTLCLKFHSVIRQIFTQPYYVAVTFLGTLRYGDKQDN